MPVIGAPFFVLAVPTFVMLSCHGGFGTMPAFNADYFGPKNVGMIHGLLPLPRGSATGSGRR